MIDAEEHTFHAAMRSGTFADYQAWEIAAARLRNGVCRHGEPIETAPDWCLDEEPTEPPDLSDIAANEGLPVATLRAALRASHPDASAFEVIGLAHRMNAGED